MKRAFHKTGAIAVGFFCAAALMWPDGGAVQFRKQAGPLIITVFGAPVPLRVGTGDFSVMVQRAKDQSTVLDAGVRLRLARSTADEVFEVTVPASHAQATNKMLYAAHVKLPSAGEWRLQAQVTAANQSVDVSGNVNVLPPEPPAMAHWPYFALIPAAILAFALNQWLKSKRGVRRPPARP